MTPAERASRLALVRDDEADRVRAEEHMIAAARRVGAWRYQFIGDEIQLRSRALPTMPLDLTRSEAKDLLCALALALNETPPLSPRVPLWRRMTDWLARRTWNRRHTVERAYAMKRLADEFREGGGW
jgi:hypothetical protein